MQFYTQKRLFRINLHFKISLSFIMRLRFRVKFVYLKAFKLNYTYFVYKSSKFQQSHLRGIWLMFGPIYKFGQISFKLPLWIQ